jgi:hypothetical protein
MDVHENSDALVFTQLARHDIDPRLLAWHSAVSIAIAILPIAAGLIARMA